MISTVTNHNTKAVTARSSVSAGCLYKIRYARDPIARIPPIISTHHHIISPIFIANIMAADHTNSHLKKIKQYAKNNIAMMVDHNIHLMSFLPNNVI